MNINLHDVEMNIKLTKSREKTEGWRTSERKLLPTSQTTSCWDVFPSLVYRETLKSEKIVWWAFYLSAFLNRHKYVASQTWG